MTQKSEKEQSSAVYETKDICRLYNCNPGEINVLIKAGTIPQPLPLYKIKAKKRWLKAKVHKHLGMDKKENLSTVEIFAIAEQVSALLKDSSAKSCS